MGCLLPIFSIFVPRGVLFLIMIFARSWYSVFETWYWPFLGWIFMPYSTLAYMGAMWHNEGHLKGWWLVLFCFAGLVDLGGQKESTKK